jgi:hypothetical protein
VDLAYPGFGDAELGADRLEIVPLEVVPADHPSFSLGEGFDRLEHLRVIGE